MKNILFIPTAFTKDAMFNRNNNSSVSIACRDENTPWTVAWYHGHPPTCEALALKFDNVDCDLSVFRLQKMLCEIEGFEGIGSWHRSRRGYWELHGFWCNTSGILIQREVNYGERFTSRMISDIDDGAYFANVEDISDSLLAIAYTAEARGLGRVEVLE